MQVNNHVSSARYTSYQRSRNAKSNAEYRSNEALNLGETATTSCPVNGSNDEEPYSAWEAQRVNSVDYQEFFKEKMSELLVKIQNGDTEPSYQIGAQSFTEKEWDEFLEQFDSVEDAIQKLMREERERRAAEQMRKEQTVIKDADSLLTTESTSCTYPTADPQDDDIRYITWYTEEGIVCRKAGQTEGYEWSVTFENREQYDKVMDLIGQFPSDWNLLFAAHENFWTDFLNDKIDMDGFMEFMKGTNKGVPDYSITVGDSMYIDKEKIQWAKYLNPLGAKFYTAEEMYQMQRELIAANQAKMAKYSQ